MDAPPVQYVTTSDGYNIAYCIAGEGTPLVIVPEPISHVQIYWTADTYMRPWLYGLADHYRLITYDSRGQGMSTRGLPPGHSVLDEVRDLEAVVRRSGIDRFVILTRSHAGVIYAVQNPEHVAALILVSVPMSGRAWPTAWVEGQAKHDWDFFLQTLAALTSPKDLRTSMERLKQATAQEDFLVRQRAAAASDVAHLLHNLRMRVLVMHPRDYRVVAQEESRKLAASIPGARLVVLDGGTSRGDADQGIRAIDSFLTGLRLESSGAKSGQPKGSAALHAGGLSPREIEVLRLLAAGKSNQQIADELVISVNTVIRHVSNIFDKIGAANRTEAAALARKAGLAD
jgi:DNA-binding CsgD family transcriptional regulator/pimeloyl-ACP methyl ester carboxylesterase